MLPSLEGFKNGKELLIMGVIIELCVMYGVLLSQGTSIHGFFRVPGQAIILGETKFGWGCYHSRLINSHKIVYTCIV